MPQARRGRNALSRPGSPALTEPMKGSSMCVCASMPPGNTYWPEASTTSLPAGTASAGPIALMMPSSQ